jgi:2-alkyl-3-oxoalkanoate reductase
VKALVTGGTGFLGRALVGRLRSEGVWVRVLTRSTAGAGLETDEAVVGSLEDVESLRRAVSGVDLVFHAGARVATTGAWVEFDQANVQGTAALIRCAQEAGVRRIVHVSSLSVYAVPCDGASITEDSPYDEAGDERGHYARSKLAADRVALQAAAGGAPVTVVRPGLLYGPGRRPPLGRKVVAVGPLRIVLGSAKYLLPLAYIDNVADALWLAAGADGAVGRAYTVVDVHAPQGEYLNLYRRTSGESWKAVYVPSSLLQGVARIAEAAAAATGRRPPMTRHQVERTLWSATFDVSRAERELGWRPRIPLEEGLKRSFAAQRAVVAGRDLEPSAAA